ncbi:MAG: hypothetical protein Q9157_002443 [Trypethelium eluteriae]
MSRRDDVLSKRLAETGTWILESENFQGWINGLGNGILYCPGIPGAGKTMIASIVADHLIRGAGGESSIVLSAYYDYKDTANQQTSKMVAGLLKQAIRISSAVEKPMKNLHNILVKGTPTIEDLGESLVSILNGFRQTYIVVDALDECYDQASRKKYLRFLEQLKKNCSGVRLFLTSRPDPHVDSLVQGQRLDIQTIQDDIAKVVDHRIASLDISIPSDLANRAREKVTRSTNGMFLLAYLHVESLKDATNEDEFEIALNKLSDSLPKAYETVIERINLLTLNQRVLAKRLIAWAVFSISPLNTGELQHALAVEIGDQAFNAKRIRSIEITLSVSAGLVTRDIKSDTIRPVHETVQEFFSQKLEFWDENPQIYLARTCLTYLAFQAPLAEMEVEQSIRKDDVILGINKFLLSLERRNSQKRSISRDHEFAMDRWQFFTYARHFWGEHLRDVAKECKHKALLLLLERKECLPKICCPNFRFCYSCSSAFDASITGLHIAAAYGLERRTPLYIAATWGNTSMIKPLYTQEVANTRCYNAGSTPLLAAAGRGCADVIKQLLSYGADVNAVGRRGNTALISASINKQVEVVGLLLSHGANILTARLRGETALHCASYSGCVDVADLLLRHGANINMGTRSNETALHWASFHGHIELVDLLLSHGADVDVRTFRSNVTALHLASFLGHTEIVDLLLRYGADAEARHSDALSANQHVLGRSLGGNPWGMSPPTIPRRTDWKLTSFVECLSGFTALHDACLVGNHKTVKLLLCHNVDVNVQTLGHRVTPLFIACAAGEVDLVKELLRSGADVNARDNQNSTPLHTARQIARRGNKRNEIVRLLLDHLTSGLGTLTGEHHA